MTEVRIKYRKFHSAQKEIYTALSRRDVLRCGRRFGKTTFLEDAAAYKAAKGSAVGWFSPNYKLLTPSYKRINTTLRPIITTSSRTEGLLTTRSGGSVEFWTLNDEDAGRSRSYDLAIIDEAGLMLKGLREIWEKSIAPTLLDRRGDAIMAGTPKGKNPDSFFYTICQDKTLGWNEFHYPTRTNPMLDPVGVANLVNEYPPLVYQQEFLAEFVDWSGAAFFSLSSLLCDGLPAGLPPRTGSVFAVIDTAVKTGREHDGTAVTYFSYDQFADVPLLILDWDLVQVEGSLLETWLPTVFQNLDAWAVKSGALLGSLGAFIEDKVSGTILIQQALRRAWKAQAIDSKLTAVGKDERAISVSGYVYRNKVKITEYAYAKMINYKGTTQNHFLSQVTGFRIGLKDQADDALDTFTYGVAIALGNSEGY